MFRNIKSEANNSPELTDYMTLCGKIGKRRFEIRYRNIPMRPTVRDNGFVAVHIFDNRVMWFPDGKKMDNIKKDSAISVGFWWQAIHKKILQRFDSSFDKKDDDENICHWNYLQIPGWLSELPAYWSGLTSLYGLTAIVGFENNFNGICFYHHFVKTGVRSP